MKRILDPEFRYVPSFATDVRKTFERVRNEQRERDAVTCKLRSISPPNRAPQKQLA